VSQVLEVPALQVRGPAFNTRTEKKKKYTPEIAQTIKDTHSQKASKYLKDVTLKKQCRAGPDDSHL
jgi:hypothetical protein